MALMAVGGGFQLNTPAGLSYLRARVAGLPAGITTATRSYSQQLDWYKNQGKPGYPAMADHPDKSKHVYRPNDKKDQGGRALDLPKGGPREWMTKNGHKYGWFLRIKSEPWHFEYEEWNDPSRNTNQGDDELSAADVAAITKHIDTRLGITEKAPNLPRVLFGPDAYYRVPNPVKPGEYFSVIDALKVLIDYVVRDFVVDSETRGAVLSLTNNPSLDVDEAALAAALAPLILESTSLLSDENLERLAKAVNDESERRLRARLEESV